LSVYVKITLEVYLVANILIQAIPMHLLWITIALQTCLMQVVGVQLVVARSWNDPLSSN
jgi:hypothetical protein